ncbi:hypothetical protein ACLX1H_009101 [Fusarium chlamydosporum]
MRIPQTRHHDVALSLMNYLNLHEGTPPSMAIQMIDYVSTHENNGFYINSGWPQCRGLDMTPTAAGWASVPEQDQGRSAGELLDDALEELIPKLNGNFDEAITIDEGMSQMPEAMAHLIRDENIMLGARVIQIVTLDDQRVRIKVTGNDGDKSMEFDRVVLAIPPTALQMATECPQ